MLIIPAIDLRDGKYVRLKQGDYALETIYGSDPAAIAQNWQAAGAKALHVVDLDGAKTGQLVNLKAIEKIISALNIPVQVGGGVQSVTELKQLLALGASKVIIGTLALEDEERLRELLARYGEKIIVSLDSKNGQLAKRGWLENSGQDLLETSIKLEKLGVKSFIYTDVLRDGTLSQPNYEGIKSLLSVLSTPLTIAGGVSGLADIKKLAALKVAGVIIGKALLEGRINIKEANDVS
jgi:phosphoribosylformimino-5-aminoimidazole carboxamide ribotide isomerase